MINEPLVYFKSESSFNNKKNQLIDASANEQVVFIGTTDKTQSGKIYTHGQFFGGVSGIDPENLDLSDYLKGTDIQYISPAIIGNPSLEEISVGTLKVKGVEDMDLKTYIPTVSYTAPVNPNDGQHAEVFVGTLNVGDNTMPMKGYVRVVSSGGGDDPVVPPTYEPYDDSWINDELENLDEKIEQAKTRLDNMHEWSENEVNTTATNAIKNMAWYASLIDENGLINYTGFADRLLGVGVITENSGTWSTLRQTVTDAENGLASLEAEVANLEMGGTDPDTMATLIASRLGMSVEDWNGVKTAVAKLESMWSTGTVDDTNTYKAAEWMLSAYRNAANQNKTFNEVISDAANAAVGSATAGLVTEVELTNKGYVSRTELASTVRDEVGNQISTSGFLTENTLGNAFATMFAENNGAKSAVLNHVTSQINTDGSAIRTAIAGLVADSGDGGNAGVYVKNTELGEKTVEILANNADAKAQIVATVNDDNSEIQISADKIIFSNNPDEKTVAMAISKNQVAISDLAATKATITQLNATNARIDALTAGTVDTTKLHTFSGETVDGDGFHVVIENGEIYGYDRDTSTYQGLPLTSDTNTFLFKNDGSGYLAKGGIVWNEDGSGYIGGEEEFSWTSDGKVKIKDLTVDQLKAKIDKLDVDTLTADVATINEQLTAAFADITDLKADRLKAKEVHSYSGDGEESSGKHVVIKDGNISCYYNDSAGNRTSGFTVNYDGTVSITKRYAADENAFDTLTITEIAVKDLTALTTKEHGRLWILPNGVNEYAVNGSGSWVVNNANGAYVYIDTSDVSVHASSFPNDSDRNLKDIGEDTSLTVEQIANAPAVNFTWKRDAEKENKKEHVGTIAQYWNVVLPQVVTESDEGILSMEYGNAAMVSSIVTAKEVVALKEQVAELQRRIDELKNI